MLARSKEEYQLIDTRCGRCVILGLISNTIFYKQKTAQTNCIHPHNTVHWTIVMFVSVLCEGACSAKQYARMHTYTQVRRQACMFEWVCDIKCFLSNLYNEAQTLFFHPHTKTRENRSLMKLFPFNLIIQTRLMQTLREPVIMFRWQKTDIESRQTGVLSWKN